jgi:hypothetical protein
LTILLQAEQRVLSADGLGFLGGSDGVHEIFSLTA